MTCDVKPAIGVLVFSLFQQYTKLWETKFFPLPFMKMPEQRERGNIPYLHQKNAAAKDYLSFDNGENHGCI